MTSSNISKDHWHRIDSELVKNFALSHFNKRLEPPVLCWKEGKALVQKLCRTEHTVTTGVICCMYFLALALIV